MNDQRLAGILKEKKGGLNQLFMFEMKNQLNSMVWRIEVAHIT